jgi:AcrR family transcriptional regulator
MDSARTDRANQIVQAAYACFEALGIEQATISDIAEAAGVRRPHVYRYFTSKSDIIYQIAELEMEKANKELEGRFNRSHSLATIVTDAMIVLFRTAQLSPYVRLALERLDEPLKWTNPANPIHHLHRARWNRLLRNVGAELAPEFSMDEIVSWLIMGEVLLISRFAPDANENELERFVHNFIVRPLMRHPVSPKTARGRSS